MTITGAEILAVAMRLAAVAAVIGAIIAKVRAIRKSPGTKKEGGKLPPP